jgi:hypothetical protein
MTLQKYFVTTQRLNKRGNNAFDRVQKDQLKDADPLHASYRFQETLSIFEKLKSSKPSHAT